MSMNQPQAQAQPPNQQDPNQLNQQMTPEEQGELKNAQIMDPNGAPPQQIDPSDLLPQVITQYLDYASQVRNDNTLDQQVKAKIMLEMAQAIQFIYPLGDQGNQANPAVDQQMKMQQHQQDLQMKHESHVMQISQQQDKHNLEVQKMQHDIEMTKAKAAIDATLNGQKAQQAEVVHQQQLNHQQDSHEQQMKQQKQAAQSKPSQKQGSKQGK